MQARPDDLLGSGRRQFPRSLSLLDFWFKGSAKAPRILMGDGDITVDELYSYVHDRVTEQRPQQRPKKVDNIEGRTVLAANVNWTLPPYLRNAVVSPLVGDARPHWRGWITSIVSVTQLFATASSTKYGDSPTMTVDQCRLRPWCG
jgi:hypothetical protein